MKEPKRRLGLRGEVLLYVGILWIIFGWVIYVSPPAPGRALALHELLPLPVRAAGWILTGVVAIFFAFRRMPGADRWGFGALLIMPFERFISWVLTPIFNGIGWLPSENIGPPLLLCLSNALVWGLITWLIYRIGASRQMLVIAPCGHVQVAQGDIADVSPRTDLEDS